MLVPMLTRLLEQSLFDGPRKAIVSAKKRIIFALLALVVGIVALIFIFYTAYLWLSLSYGPQQAAGMIAGLLVLLTAGCVAGVCWPADKTIEAPPPPPPPEAEAVLAIEQLSRSMSELGRGKNGGMAMLGILAGVAALGFGLGRKK